MNRKHWFAAGAIVLIVAGLYGLAMDTVSSVPALTSDFGTLRPGPTDVTVGELYELDQPVGVSRKDTTAGRVYEIHFGGADRNRRPQYVYSQDLVLTDKVPAGTVRWVSESSYRELEGIVYDNSTSTRTKTLVNPLKDQMARNHSFPGGQPRHR